MITERFSIIGCQIRQPHNLNKQPPGLDVDDHNSCRTQFPPKTYENNCVVRTVFHPDYTYSDFVGEDYTVEAFIPGSQIVLNITDNFETGQPEIAVLYFSEFLKYLFLFERGTK